MYVLSQFKAAGQSRPVTGKWSNARSLALVSKSVKRATDGRTPDGRPARALKPSSYASPYRSHMSCFEGTKMHESRMKESGTIIDTL